MSLAPGSRLGPYDIVSALGAGGMGEVYRARDTRLNRDVALKVLPPDFSADPERLRRLEQEAQAAASLSHANILAVYDIGVQDGTTFVVSELLDGQTLRQAISAGALPARRAIGYGIDVARGLAAAHERGIVHRDLKPENVMVTADRRVKILDFGLAKIVVPAGAAADATVAALATQPGLVMGTIGYMAPEQVRGAEVDHRADIFSFGAILYELLSGRRAFEENTPADTMSAILNAEPPDLARADAAVPAALERIVRRCLEKDPRERFQSARDLAFALEATMEAGAPAGPAAARAGKRPSPMLAALVAAVAVLAALAGAAASRLLRTDPAGARYELAVLPPDDVVVDGPLSLSPEGRRLAFTGMAPDGSRFLWVRKLDAADAQAVPGTEDAWAPFWSPDGRSVAFFAHSKLKRVDLAGGPPQLLAEVTEPRGGAWNADGTIIFAPHAGDGLYRVPAAGGAASRLTTLDAQRQEVSHRWPLFLPDGRTVLFMNRAATGAERLAIFAVSLDAPTTPRRIMAASSTGIFADGRLIFRRADTVFAQPFDAARLQLSGEMVPLAKKVWFEQNMDGLDAFSAAAGTFAYRPAHRGSRFVWMDRAGEPIGAIGPEGADTPVLSPDGRRVLFALTDADTHAFGLWLLDVARGSLSRQTLTPRNDTEPIWSPDGARAVFSSDRSGTFDLYEKVIGESGDRLLLKSERWKWAESWSPDGGHIMYSEDDPKTHRDLWILPLTGERQPVPFLETDASEFSGRFSPDGRWVAYVSDESGRDEIYVRAYPSGLRAIQVSATGGVEPFWTKTGRELIFLAPDNRLMAAACAVTAKGFDAGVPSPLFPLRVSRTNDTERTFAVSADGSRFLVNQMNTDVRGSAMTVIVNWLQPSGR